MNIYFGKVGKNESTEDLFEHEGEYYYYKIVLENDQFVIEDTCNRRVPFEYSSTKSLYNAIKYLHHTESAKRAADTWLSDSLRNIGKMYGIKADATY